MIDQKKLQQLPSSSGIYQFLCKGKPIYIGKSVNIKARVLSHIQAAQLSKKEALIVDNADGIIFQNTISDFDAIVLEAQLIKKYRPKYNIALKDDKHFLYIKITIKDAYPKVFPVRAENDGKSLYFGPFNSNDVTEKLLYHIRRVIPFCTQKKIGKRSCFYSKIGLCSPCPSYIAMQNKTIQERLKREYQLHIRTLISILKGEGTKVINTLLKTLDEQTLSQDFEGAIQTRDAILALNAILYSRSFSTFDSLDYSKRSLVKQELEIFLKKNFNKDYIRNAYRIECFDMSTLFGSDSTGSLVVFEDGALNTSQYRRFKIKSDARSDFQRIDEVLRRRFKHIEWQLPDLLIIDGGRPQVRIAKQVLNDMQLNIPVIGLAKNPDRIVIENKTSAGVLKRSSILFKTIQLLRDESHRFAKKYHLLLKDKKLMV